MMIKKKNVEGHSLTSPQDPTWEKPVPWIIVPRLVETINANSSKIAGLLKLFRLKRSHSLFVSGGFQKVAKSIIPAIKISDYDTEKLRESYEQFDFQVKRGITTELDNISRLHCVTGSLFLSWDRVCWSRTNPVDVPLPIQNKYEILELERSEEERDAEDLERFRAAALHWDKKRVKQNNKNNAKRRKDLERNVINFTGSKESERHQPNKKKKNKKNEKIIKIGKEEVPQGLFLRKRYKEMILELDIDYRCHLESRFIHTNRSKIWTFAPERLEKFFFIVEQLEKNGAPRVLVPRFLRILFHCKIALKAYDLLNLLEMYNICYNIYWTCRAYEIYLSQGQLRKLAELNYENKKKKNLLCGPFEDYMNNPKIYETYENYKKKEKKNKKKNIRKKISEKKETRVLTKNLFNDWGFEDNFMKSLPNEDFISFMFSLYMGKKNIFLVRSDGLSCLSNHKKLMMRETTLDPEFRKFVAEETARLFNRYSMKKSMFHTPPSSSYFYKNESVNLHNYIVKEGVQRDEYNEFIRSDKLIGPWEQFFDDFVNSPNTHSVKIIREKGKTRVITTNHPASYLMKNLQWSIHSHLKVLPEFKYIGTAIRSEVYLDFKKNDWVLSGDYSNSTDFIPTELTRVIYDTILSKIRGHPNLKRLVRHTLEKEMLDYGDEIIEMKSGQLMGGLLSFPALCILNHCIARFLGINSRKVNGDDLLAACTLGSRQRWVDESERLGMSPNDSKSHFHPKYGTFNSQLLSRRGRVLRHICHFQVAKISHADLLDITNVSNRNTHRDRVRSKRYAQVFFQNQEELSLFKGLEYPDECSQWTTHVDFHKINEIRKHGGSFIGSVGSLSAQWTPNEELDHMVSRNWRTMIKGEKIAIGNGNMLSYYRGEWEGIKGGFSLDGQRFGS